MDMRLVQGRSWVGVYGTVQSLLQVVTLCTRNSSRDINGGHRIYTGPTLRGRCTAHASFFCHGPDRVCMSHHHSCCTALHRGPHIRSASLTHFSSDIPPETRESFNTSPHLSLVRVIVGVVVQRVIKDAISVQYSPVIAVLPFGSSLP